jgi:hypothetical protein
MVNAEGKRTTRTNWDHVNSRLRERGLGPLDSAQGRSLRSPLSDASAAFTALGGFVVRARDKGVGVRTGVRFVRFTLLPLGSHVMISARHRDGIAWIDPPGGADPDRLRESALLKEDPYSGQALLNAVEQSGRIGPASSAHDLIFEILHASTRAYQRSLLAKLNELLNRAEERFAAETVDATTTGVSGGSPPTAQLLSLISAIGQITPEIREVREDLVRRCETSPFARAEEIDSNYGRILDRLEQLRADARTAVDMFASTISSAQLELSRSEAAAAAAERTRRDEDADARREREAEQQRRDRRLAQVVTVATSVLLIPTLVASIFGANVKLPREGTVWETWLMVACMLGFGSLTFAVLSGLGPAQMKSGRVRKWTPYILATVALAAAALIAASVSFGRLLSKL